MIQRLMIEWGSHLHNSPDTDYTETGKLYSHCNHIHLVVCRDTTAVSCCRFGPAVTRENVSAVLPSFQNKHNSWHRKVPRCARSNQLTYLWKRQAMSFFFRAHSPLPCTEYTSQDKDQAISARFRFPVVLLSILALWLQINLILTIASNKSTQEP